jgi:glycosyltransferase involved in cell wall biosynthesis
MAGKKKLLFLEYFDFIGGGQAVLLRLLKHLKESYDIRVLLFNRGAIEAELVKLEVPYDFIQAPKRVKYRYFWDFIPFNKKVIAYLRQLKPDLVYASGYFAVKLISPAVKRCKVPLLWHKHQIIERAPFSYLSRQVRYLSSFASKIICISEAARVSLIKSGVNPSKLITVYNGIEVPKLNKKAIRQRVNKEHRLGKNFVIGTVGFFRRNKGFELLIRAAAILKKEKLPVKVLIVGKAEKDTAYENELRALVWELDLEGTVIFTGRRDKFDYLPAFDLFVLPSHNEPFGLVTVEAMACSVPVAAFGFGGTAEIINDGENGFLAKEISAQALAGQIMKAYKNPRAMKKIAANGLITVKKRFSTQQQVRKVKTIIDSLI